MSSPSPDPSPLSTAAQAPSPPLRVRRANDAYCEYAPRGFVLTSPSASAVPGGRAIISQRRRERILRDDPLATILTPQMVLCNRCNAKIKLSVKSAFDDFHWTRHRDRCLKRSDATAAELRESNGQVSLESCFRCQH